MPLCPCVCVFHHPCSLCLPFLVALSCVAVFSHCPHPSPRRAAPCTQNLRLWRRMGPLAFSAKSKDCQHPSLPGRRTGCDCLRSLGECPAGGVGSGSQRAGRLGSGTFLETGILRVKVAPFAQTDLGASHHQMLSSFLWSQREIGPEVFLLPRRRHLPSYAAWVKSSDQVLQSICSLTTCFIEEETKGQRGAVFYPKATQ